MQKGGDWKERNDIKHAEKSDRYTKRGNMHDSSETTETMADIMADEQEDDVKPKSHSYQGHVNGY